MSGRVTGAGTLVLLAVVGCQPGVSWRLGSYREAQAAAAEEGRLTFVYFRNWFARESTEFEDNVLKAPRVRAALDEMVCVPLEHSIRKDKALARSWGLDEVPALAVVGPQGRVLETAQGDITQEELLNLLARAKAEVSPLTKPARAP